MKKRGPAVKQSFAVREAPIRAGFPASLRTILAAGAFFLAFPFSSQAQTPASITLNAATTLTTFIPVNVFGINAAAWLTKADHWGALPKVQAAGNYFIRFPGGGADNFHWNGKGTVNANGYWVPDDTNYLPSFQDNVAHLGTTSSYGLASHLTDGNAGTTWMSNVDTDFPNAQWAYLDLGSSQPIDSVTLVWGNPYATLFTIQYWDPTAWNQWAPYLDTASHWLDTTAVAVTGPGGTQGVGFTAVTSRYLRILLTAASGPVTADLGTVTVIGPAYAMAEAYAYHGSTRVSVNTYISGTQSQAVVSSTDPAISHGNTLDLDFESFMTMAHSFPTYVPPLLSVNMGTGTPQEAAAWVHYANIVKGYGIKYWQIGNEIEGTWEWGGPMNSRDYVRRYIEFYEAMKTVDPSIVVTGPDSSNFNSSSNLYDGQGTVQDFISFLNAQGKASYVNAIDFHWYPTYQPVPAATVLAIPAQISGFAVSLAGWISGTAVDPNVPVLMSEYNLGTGPGLSMLNQWVNGLWLADSLGQYAGSFGPRGSTNFFAMISGGTDTTDSTQGDLGYLQVESGPYQYQERGTYWAYKMAATDWAIAGDSSPNTLVSVSSSQPLLKVYADDRPDHVLSLMVLDEDPSNAYAATLSLAGFSPQPTATGWTFDSSHYAWDTTSVPYHANPDLPPSPVTITGVSSSFPVTFKPYSLTVLQFADATLSTATPSASPTPSVTPTPTLTATNTMTLSATPTPTLTATSTASNTPTPLPQNDVLFPNPWNGTVPLALYHMVNQAVDSVRLKIYTVAFRKIYEDDTLAASAGQHLYALDRDKAGNLSNGLYYLVMDEVSGGKEHPQIFKLLILR